MSAWRDALSTVRERCEFELERVRATGLPCPTLDGQLIRPLLGYAAGGGELSGSEWQALLAVQYAHEASLLHDDVIDAAARRRGQPTVAAAHGVAAALVQGDHLLTAGYRLAARTGSLRFVETYARAVERTVAGERLQHERRGVVLARSEYEAVVLGKSGELIGCAFAAPAVLRRDPHAELFFEVGRRIGVCYQMVDDLLDYCAAAENGKSAFGDYRQRLWTWPLAHLPGAVWPEHEEALHAALRTRDAQGRTPLERALEELRAVCARTAADVRRLLPQDVVIPSLLNDWVERAGDAVRASTIDEVPLPELPTRGALSRFFSANARSFAFAARFLPRAERTRVADIYAFCRVTDDVVDGVAADRAHTARVLDAWENFCRRAYDGDRTGVHALDRVLANAAREGVPFEYVRDLLAGMRMDLDTHRYASLAQLRVYTYRVASVVGLWLTRAWGVHDPAVLQRAAELGHAMQLTNILRDVGEDLRRGRIYLPQDLLARYQVDDALLARLTAGAPIPARYRALIEELMAVADTYYQRAFEAIPALPWRARFGVAIAAEVYRGIHAEIRANGYDNLRQRAHTSLPRKLWLALRGLLRLARVPAPALRLARAAAVAVLLALATVAACAGQSLDQLRTLYRTSVEREAALPEARTALDALRAADTANSPLLQAYDGALYLAAAKHGWLAPARWRDARRGLSALDAAVDRAPMDLEVRYLRLINIYHLPGIFGRSEMVPRDATVLADLLLQGRDADPEIARAATRFLLAYERLAPATRERLSALETVHE